eukprot:CAMPEP_0203687130 /NCGR_PEP_ID=MMETSP0091-20130426/120_1 /ASSEMBLY_ACC=CAM_ASM_001089 /TAXON_ID=426623 /ORGANISM="Chaetoceros affinis, Strain CCMP159" /LENGTH=967 /DNA_ID=CAMNT_0050556389 /DNA_START=253 /DNA_END=3157 /DNA_ORIENTATION=-
MNSRVYGKRTKPFNELPIEGPKYRGKDRWEADLANHLRKEAKQTDRESKGQNQALRGGKIGSMDEAEDFERELGSQLSGCCTTYSSYSADNMCYKYGENCATGDMPSHDSGDADCSMAGLSFIGISFSVNTANGNPYSYQLCDQYPMENIIDRDYDYVMSMDEDGWLVGGGYKSFDYSGKMPYIDSSHTELLRIGSLDPEYGGTTIAQVYAAMSSISFPPFSIFPEYVKGGGKGGSGDNDDEEVPSGDVTLIVSVVEEFENNNNYSLYEYFLDNLFNAMDAVNGGPCMDDHDTDPHVSMSRGVKFKSSYHETQYFYKVNLEVAVWQSMYPNGVVIGTNSKANFPPNNAQKNRQYVGYGNLYFFFDRANITKAFPPNRDLYNSESYYSTLYMNNDVSSFYASTTTIDFDYSGSGSKDKNQYYEHNPYRWNAGMAMHDMTDGWDLPPNCQQEGETFLGIPLSRSSGSKLLSSSTFQNQFDFEYLVDRNYTYMQSFGTNHGWLIGEILNNGPGSIVDKDTSHIPLFYTGTTNPNMGGISLSNLIKVVKEISFGTLYIKPAFLFQDEDGSVKLQFEADSSSALGYLYDNLCKMLGLSWNYDSPYNKYDVYTNCAMHAAGDRAKYGCGPGNANSGGFCPQMTVGYRVEFQSEDAAADFFARGNNYVDYWRAKYPSGVAVGTDKFCSGGGCLGLFLNRYDLYQVFKPEMGGSWVEYNGATYAPTISPAPTADGGCDNPHNRHLDKCFRKMNPRRAPSVAWESLGPVGQLSVFLVSFMAITLSTSIFLARARKKRRRGESYMGFLMRDMTSRKKRRKKKLRKRRTKNKELEEGMLDSGDKSSRPPRSKSKKGEAAANHAMVDRPVGAQANGVMNQVGGQVQGTGHTVAVPPRGGMKKAAAAVHLVREAGVDRGENLLQRENQVEVALDPGANVILKKITNLKICQDASLFKSAATKMYVNVCLPPVSSLTLLRN